MPETAFTLLTPANNSGVLGLARTTLDGATLTVDVVASGLTPGQVHPLHLHGFLDDRTERLAVAADDTDGDGFVETDEGEVAYGPVLAGLTASGDAIFGLQTSLDFPVAAPDGTLRFSQTYTLDAVDAGDATILERLTARLEGRVLEFHGLDLPAGLGAGTLGEVNGAAGYEPQAPVAAGALLNPGDFLTSLIAARIGTAPDPFVTEGAGLLALQAPYSLAPTGLGPVAPEPPGAATPGTDTYAALLAPSNGSGAVGAALVTLDRANTSLTLDLRMTGLEPGEHASHIHGFLDGRPSLLPNYRLDADRDGFVEDDEGAPVVGPTLLALTEDGTVSNAKIGLDFPAADASGNLTLRQTYDFDENDAGEAAIFASLAQRLAGRQVQLHGLTLPATQGEATPGEVNGTAGFKDELPVANGALLPVQDAATAVRLVELFASLEKEIAASPTPLDFDTISMRVIDDLGLAEGSEVETLITDAFDDLDLPKGSEVETLVTEALACLGSSTDLFA